MKTEKSKKKYTPKPTHFLVFLVAFLSIVATIYLYVGSPKKELRINLPQSLFSEKDTWAFYKDKNQAFNGGPYKEDKHRGTAEDYTSVTTYRHGEGGRLLSKRETTYKNGKTNTDYFLLRPLDTSDAMALHQLVKNSGKEHFGKEPTYEKYGQNPEKSLLAIQKRDKREYGIFFSPTGQAHDYKIVGVLGINSVEDHAKKDTDEKNRAFSYFTGTPNVTGVRGIVAPTLWGLILDYYEKQPKSSRLELAIHCENEKSQSIVQKLHFEKVDENTEIFDENRKNKDMRTYVLTWERYEKYYLGQEAQEE